MVMRGRGYSNESCVAVTENETVTDVNALVKTLVDDVETNHPRG